MKSRFRSRILISSIVASAMLVGLNAEGQRPTPAGYTVTDLGTLGGSYSFAYSINGVGTVAGGAATPSQSNFVAQTAVLWYTGQPINLGTLGGSACPDCSSEGAAASMIGEAAVLSETSVSNGPTGEDFCEFGTHRQCLAGVWRRGVLTALPTLPGCNNSEAFFMNDWGEAVGVSETGTADSTCLTPFQTQQFEAVKWSRGGAPTPLAPLPGDTVSFAFMNNNLGQGSACLARARTSCGLPSRPAAQARRVRCCGMQTERPMTSAIPREARVFSTSPTASTIKARWR